MCPLDRKGAFSGLVYRDLGWKILYVIECTKILTRDFPRSNSENCVFFTHSTCQDIIFAIKKSLEKGQNDANSLLTLYGKVYSPVTEVSIGTGPARAFSYEHIQIFRKEIVVRRGLGNRASPVNRDHMPLHMIPVTGLARLAGRILPSVHMEFCT